ncbi:hypothetical protein Emed_004609 [Eimeria media]
MEKHAGKTEALGLEQSSTPADLGIQPTVSDKNILGSPMKTDNVQTSPLKETSVTCGTASSSPVAVSPFPPAAGVAPEVEQEEQDTLPLAPCFAVDGSVSGPSLSPAEPSADAASVLLCGPADDSSEIAASVAAAAAAEAEALAAAAAAAEAEALAAAAAAAEAEALAAAAAVNSAATAPLAARTFGALRAWEATKAAAAAAASAAATTVAATDFSGLSEATASVLAAAGGGLGAVRGLSTDRSQKQGDTSITSNDAASAGPAGHQQRPTPTGNAGNTSNNEAGRSRLLGLLQMPALPQWLCSSSGTSTSNAALGCPPTLADKDTELQGSEADAAAAAHMAAVVAASAVTNSIGALTKDATDGCSDEPAKPFTPNAAPEPTAATGYSVLPPGAEHSALTGIAGVPLALDSNFQRGNPASTGLSDKSTSDEASAPADTAERLLQLLEERAACAATLTSSSSGPAEEVDTSVLQQQLLQLQEATDAVLAAGPGLMQLDAAGLESISPEAVAATAERAERVIKEQKQTAWASLLSSLAESSRRSVKAVQRVAGTAACASGAEAPASTDSSVFPLFGACRNPATHVEGDAQADQSCRAQQNGVGEIQSPDSFLADRSGQPQAEPEPVGTQAARLGVLIALQRRQQAIAEELRQRSANLLQHSVALTTSATLSEARYHLAEIVDTGGPEVSGVWAGFKVGLGIVTLASGHLLLGGAMVAVATGSLGSAVMWSRHRRLFYEMMRGNFTGTEEQTEASTTPDAAGAPAGGAEAADGTSGDKEESSEQPETAPLASTGEEGHICDVNEVEPSLVGVEEPLAKPSVSPALPEDESLAEDVPQSCSAHQADGLFADCSEVLEDAIGEETAVTADLPVTGGNSGQLQNKDSAMC